jgi:RHS repeat-associated protein
VRLFSKNVIALIPFLVCATFLSHATERNWNYTYNSLGLIETANGPRTDVSDVTTYAYDAQGRLIQVTNALGHITQLSNFDVLGNPQTVIDANNVTTTLNYSPRGWLTSSTTAGSTTSFEHDAIGQITKVTRGDGSWLQYTWSAARRLSEIANNLGESVEYDYDTMGNRTAQRLKDASNTLTQQQSWVYDELGRLLRSIGAANQTTQFGYDLNDNPTLSTTPKQHSTTSSYDALDRLVSSTDPLNGVSAFSYDAQDNLIQVTDPRGVVTQYEYDGLGNLTKQISPDSGTTLYNHDAAGNVISKTDARGVVTTYTYDALNRMTHKRYPATPVLNVQYFYDMTANGNHGVGRLTAIQDSSGVLGYDYDAHGNLIGQIRSVEVVNTDHYSGLGYEYDASNRLVKIKYPVGFSVLYVRNTVGQVSKVQLQVGNYAPSTVADQIEYMPFGPLKSLTWANGIGLTRTYDQDYRLTHQQVATWASTYNYDANSNIESLLSSLSGNHTYNYDALDRLTSEQKDDLQQSYTYDAVGNRLSKTSMPILGGSSQPSSTVALNYSATSNRLTEIAGFPVSSDVVGNITQDRPARQMEYDQQNRLSRVKNGGITVAEYRYNALGQRTHKITSTGITTFLYDHSGQLLEEAHYSLGGQLQTSQYYAWLEGLPLAGITVIHGTNGSASSEPFFLHFDHLGAPRVATNSNPQIVWRWISDAYGVGDASGSLTINLRFPGQYYDSESGLYYNYFRDYDPETGRYVESDPIGLKGGLNTYGYVGGNPLSLSDPKGLWSVSVEGYLGVGGGVSVSYSDGTLEVLGRLAVGFGGGASWDPYGIPSPHSKSCGNGYIARASTKVSAGGHVGPIGGGAAATFSAGNALTDKEGGGFNSVDVEATGEASAQNGISVSVSSGVDIGSYSNW